MEKKEFIERRIAAIKDEIKNLNLDAFLVSYLPNIFYLSNYSGSSGLLLFQDEKLHFFTDFRYQEQVKEEVMGGYEIHILKELWSGILAFLKGFKKIGIEGEYLSVNLTHNLQKQLGNKTKIVPQEDFLMEMRAVKDSFELACIKKAQMITEQTFADILKLIVPEKLTERDLACEIEYQFKKMGAKQAAFSSIVAQGEHTALPHAKPRNVSLKPNTMILFDMGANYEGYASDMTRTVWLGNKIPDKFIEIYAIVKEVQAKAKRAMKENLVAQKLDTLVREEIITRGYGDYFGHGLGHGVGLEVHERPRVGPRSGDILKAGMVFTLEPGIYLPGFGGVRIEDMVSLKNNGCEVLTNFSTELIKL